MSRKSRPASLRRLSIFLLAALPVLLPLSTTFMAWKGLCILTSSSIPIVCVVSDSMAPAFHRGDILFIWNRTVSVEVGDIPVVWFDGNPLPMVHRVIQVYSDASNQSQETFPGQNFLTKGDNNAVNDVALYPGDRISIARDEVKGFARGYVPLIGWIVILLQEVHQLWYLLLTIPVILSFIER